MSMYLLCFSTNLTADAVLYVRVVKIGQVAYARVSKQPLIEP